MTVHSHPDLCKKTVAELEAIREQKTDELTAMNHRRFSLVSHIEYFQNLIDQEHKLIEEALAADGSVCEADDG